MIEKHELKEVLKEFSDNINVPIRQVTIPLQEYDKYRDMENEFAHAIYNRGLVKSKIKYVLDNKDMCGNQYLIDTINYINNTI